MTTDAPRLGTTPHTGFLVLLGVVVLVGIGISVGPTAASGDGQANLTLYAGDDVALTDAGAIETAIANETLTPTDRMVAGGTLVVAIESERLTTDVADGNGTSTERFFDALDGEATFLLAQTNPSANRPRKVVRPGPRNTTIYTAGNTTYAILETAAFDYRWGSIDHNRTTELWDGDRFAVAFGYGVDTPDGPKVELFTTPAEIHLRGPLAPERINRTVSVYVQPEASLFVRATIGTNRTLTAPVSPVPGAEDRRVSLDLGGVSPGTPYEIELVHDGTVVDRASGTVVDPRATVRNVSVATVDNRTVVNATVTVTHPGELQVVNESDVELGSTWIGSTYRDNATRVTVRLHDGNADTLDIRAVRARGDRPYPRYPGSAATVTLDVSHRDIRGRSPPSLTKTTVPPTSVETTETPVVTSRTERPTTAGGNGPGFGSVAAVVAVLAMAVGLRVA